MQDDWNKSDDTSDDAAAADSSTGTGEESWNDEKKEDAPEGDDAAWKPGADDEDSAAV